MKALYFTASSSSGDKRWEKGVGGKRSLFSDGKNTKPGNELGTTTLMLQKKTKDARLERF